MFPKNLPTALVQISLGNETNQHNTNLKILLLIEAAGFFYVRREVVLEHADIDGGVTEKEWKVADIEGEVMEKE